MPEIDVEEHVFEACNVGTAVRGAGTKTVVLHLAVRQLVVIVLVIDAVPAERRPAAAAVELHGADARVSTRERHRQDVDLQVGDRGVVRLELELTALHILEGSGAVLDGGVIAAQTAGPDLNLQAANGREVRVELAFVLAAQALELEVVELAL